MKKSFTAVGLFILWCSVSHAQVSSDYAVMLTASVTEIPASITVQWPSYATASSYTVYRKKKTATAWGSSLASLSGTATAYTDNGVVADSGYEYRVERFSSSGIVAEGYIYAAIKLHATDYRGKCLLVVDTTVTSTMEPELYRLMKDISGDGWAIKRINISRNDSVPFIKNLVVAEYNSDADVKSVLLFGHVPVPYSGNMNPDGHPDHLGAWPCDGFYGDLNGNYTDQFVNNATASNPANWNVPGDGKFDQSIFPGEVTLQVGRVDLYDLPSFADSEKVLLKNYLDKDHDFRWGNFTAAPRGLIDDNFGAFGGEAFASVGFRNFAPLMGDTAVHELDYFTTMQQDSYLWSFGCGGGWYQGAGGVGATTDFVNDTVQTVFTMLFGSYFGDWNNTDDFLRAPLASKNRALTSCWAGRPYWFFHHMALGENIGYSTALSQNNFSTYAPNICASWVHIALMGDPTLHMSIVKPPSAISLAIPAGDSTVVGISWMPSPDSVAGYAVYRSNEEFGKYLRISDTLVTDLAFVDQSPANGNSWYMMRAVKLEETPSGSYYNLSEGITDSLTILISAITAPSVGAGTFFIYPNPSAGDFFIHTSETLMGAQVELTEAAGRVILRQQIVSVNTAVHAQWLPAGIYFVRINGLVHKIALN